MIEATKQTILSMRQLASDLRPSILDNFGLIPAIEWQLSEFQKRTRIRARLHCEGDRAGGVDCGGLIGTDIIDGRIVAFRGDVPAGTISNEVCRPRH
jgi:hypothetical protein